MTRGRRCAYDSTTHQQRWGTALNKTLKFLLFLAIVLAIAAVLFTDLVGFVRFSTPRNIRLHNPVTGFDHPLRFLAAGDAWTPSGLPPVYVRATNQESGQSLTFEATRETVKYRGKAVKDLAAFSALVDLPAAGNWEFVAVMEETSKDGIASLSTKPRLITVRDGAPSRMFAAFGTSHLIVLAALLALFAIMIIRYRKPRGEKEVRAVSLALTLVLFVNEISYHVYWVAIDAWTTSNTLMIHMCSIAVFVLPFLLFMKPSVARHRLFEVIYFFCVGGALQAYLAPDIWVHSFPEIRFFTFFVAHGLLVLGAVFLALTSGMQLTFGSYLRGGAVTLAATAAAYGIDQVLRLIPPFEPSNYFLIGYPPPTGSIIDLFANIFGPSPAYGIGLALMGIVLFAALYVPFPIVRFVKARRGR